MASLNLSFFSLSLTTKSPQKPSFINTSRLYLPSKFCTSPFSLTRPGSNGAPFSGGVRVSAVDGDYSARRSSSNEQRETILLPGCDFNHWLIVMEFPKDPAPTRAQMIDTYLETLATVLGSMEEAKKNMYAFSTTTYTGFQCTVSEETSEKFKGLPGVLWVLPDSYLDVKNKDYGGDKYVNGEIIPSTTQYPIYNPKQSPKTTKYESKKYVRQRDGPPAKKKAPEQEATASSEQSST